MSSGPQEIVPGGPSRFFTEIAPSGKTHALWCPPDGPGMEPAEMPDRTVCGRDATEEWEPFSNSEYPTCKVCLSAIYSIYAEPAQPKSLAEVEGFIRG